MAADLSHAHPDLRAAIDRILPAIKAMGYPMVVLECERSLERQQRLYSQGRHGVGSIVTNCDGVRAKSLHQVQSDGYVHAADLVFIVNGKPSWSTTLPWADYGYLVRDCGLVWGGAFKSASGKSRADSPHMEVPLVKR